MDEKQITMPLYSTDSVHKHNNKNRKQPLSRIDLVVHHDINKNHTSSTENNFDQTISNKKQESKKNLNDKRK